MSRTNLSDQFTPEQRKSWKPKIVARNTFRFERDGETVFRLHGTDIVTRRADGSCILRDGGWKTVTTKDRMNAYMIPGFRLVQESGAWYVCGNGKRLPYFDGITLPRDFENKTKKGEKQKAREDRLRASIRKFVAKINKMQQLPEPSSGDCWYCCMHTADGKSLGDSSGDKTHLESHIKEGYLHGSLILNALKWARYQDPWFYFCHGPRDGVKRALKRYLYRQLGLVS